MMAVAWVDRSECSGLGPGRPRGIGAALVGKAAAAAGLGPVAVVRGAAGERPGLSVPGLRHSVAHAGPLTVCALADANVGIDLEVRGHRRERRLRPAGLHRFLTPGERELLAREPSQLPDVFTRKEAWAKYSGRGLALGLGSIDVEAILRARPDLRLATFDLRDAACSLWFPAGEHLAPVQVEITAADLNPEDRR